MYRGELVRLRALTRDDMARAKEYLNDYDVRKTLQDTVPYPYTLEDEFKFFEGISAKNDTYTFAIDTLNGKYIGGCGINHLDWKNSKAEVGLMIGDKSFWNKGYGTDAMKVLVRFIFEEMNINKIKLKVSSFNGGGVRCYEKCGFKVEGVLKQEIFRGGAYHDELVMALLREDYYIKFDNLGGK